MQLILQLPQLFQATPQKVQAASGWMEPIPSLVFQILNTLFQTNNESDSMSDFSSFQVLISSEETLKSDPSHLKKRRTPWNQRALDGPNPTKKH